MRAAEGGEERRDQAAAGRALDRLALVGAGDVVKAHLRFSVSARLPDRFGWVEGGRLPGDAAQTGGHFFPAR